MMAPAMMEVSTSAQVPFANWRCREACDTIQCRDEGLSPRALLVKVREGDVPTHPSFTLICSRPAGLGDALLHGEGD